MARENSSSKSAGPLHGAALRARAEEVEQRQFQRFNRGEKIRHQHHQSALADNFHGVLKRSNQVSRASGGWFFQREHQLPQVSEAMTRWQIIAHLIVERQQADGIALQMQK